MKIVSSNIDKLKSHIPVFGTSKLPILLLIAFPSFIYYREIHKMIEELEKTESTWSRLPIAGRNKAMLQKWKKELKVSSSCLLFI